jgi:hypothetical protein
MGTLGLLAELSGSPGVFPKKLQQNLGGGFTEMATIKKTGYDTWEAKTGDETIDKEYGDQLKVTAEELSRAIAVENVSDKLFARILKNRSKAHKALIDSVPGVNGEA